MLDDHRSPLSLLTENSLWTDQSPQLTDRSCFGVPRDRTTRFKAIAVFLLGHCDLKELLC